MKLTWIHGNGPPTTQKLADEVEAEGKLYTGMFCTHNGERCLWGVVEDRYPTGYRRVLTGESVEQLYLAELGIHNNDLFRGTPKERCAEMVRRLREIK